MPEYIANRARTAGGMAYACLRCRCGGEAVLAKGGESYQKTGYLRGQFHLFYLKEPPRGPVPVHYHDFHKIMILLDGAIRYSIEGREYALVPGDVVLVRAGELHAPLFPENAVYERLIIYLARDFARDDSLAAECPQLMQCFAPGPEQSLQRVIRLSGEKARRISRTGADLVRLVRDERPDAPFFRKIKLCELLILLGRASGPAREGTPEAEAERQAAAGQDPMLAQILQYIALNLREPDLGIDSIAGQFALSRSGLMHLFRRRMGCSVGSYIAEKRLFAARSSIAEGMPVTQACYESGFGSYGAFYHAYRRRYGAPPRAGRSPLPGVMEE